MTLYNEQEGLWRDRDTANFYWNWKGGMRRSKWFAKKVKKYNITSIFEVGCNSGRNLKEIIDKIDIRVGGIDINSEAIKKAKIMIPAGNFICGSIYDMDIEDKYDLVFTMGTMIHIPPDKIMLAIQNCIEKSNKIIVHMERLGQDKIINGPKYMKPSGKISKKLLWNPNLNKMYQELGFKTNLKILPSHLRADDMRHILVIKK